MSKNNLFKYLIIPTSVLSIVGCSPKIDENVVEISVNSKTTIYSVGEEFNSNCFTLIATYADKTTKEIKEGYSVDPSLPYTFKSNDISKGKEFKFTYNNLNATFHVDVVKAPGKNEAQFTFNNYDGSSLEKVNITKGKNVEYSGELPTKPNNNEKSNVFVGWDSELGIASENKTFIAQFEEYEKPDKFIDNDCDGLPKEIDTDDNNNNFEVEASSEYVTFDQSITIDFSKFLKEGANKNYDNDLAKLGLFLSYPGITFKDGLFNRFDYGKKNAMWLRLGFDDFHIFDFINNDYKYDTYDSTSGVYGHKYLYDKEGNIIKDLIVISFDGTSGVKRWSSNFDMGYDSDDYYSKEGSKENHPEWTNKNYHKGFYVAASRIFADTIEGKSGTVEGPVKLLEYIENHSSKSDGKPIIFITGHSRGGAMANIVGEYFENRYKNETGKDCTPFTYTFASPKVWGNKDEIPSTSTIFNIINADDIVPKVPATDWGFSRFGTDKIVVSIKEKYEDLYNENKEGKVYTYITNAEKIITDLACNSREEIYNLNNDNKYLSSKPLGTYDTLEEAEVGVNSIKVDCFKKFGEFINYFDLKIIEVPISETTVKYEVHANCCLGTLIKAIQILLTNKSIFIAHFITISKILLNKSFGNLLIDLLKEIVSGSIDKVALPHDYGSYHIILRENK